MTVATGQPVVPAVAAGPRLHDIHLPAAPSWWPPAPGWWLLAALLLVLSMIVVWAWLRRRRMHRQRQQVLDELEQLVRQRRDEGSTAALLQDLHQLLRRVARQHEVRATRQQGKAWRETLARVPVDAATLDQLLALDLLIYQPPDHGDGEATVAAVRRWLCLAVKPSNWKETAPEQETADA